MADFSIVFYEKENGDCPVAEFLSSLNKEMKMKMYHQLDMLETYGNIPKGDGTKAVVDAEGVFEVRAQNKTDISRCLFFFDKEVRGRIVVTNGFIKKKDKVPWAEVHLCEECREDYSKRRLEFSEKERIRTGVLPNTTGPKWRPKLDAIVSSAETQQKNQTPQKQDKNKNKNKKKGAR